MARSLTSEVPQFCALSPAAALRPLALGRDFPLDRIVNLGVVLLKTPQPRLDPRKNQNGTLAEDALLMEKFISAESVR